MIMSRLNVVTSIGVSSSAFSVTKIAERPDSMRFIFQKG